MPEYRPGPWEAVEVDNEYLVRQKAGGRGYICQLRNNPNAKLIAAAPEMYETLNKTRTALWMVKEHALIVNRNTAAVIDEAIIEAEKAMAKAEGRRA